MTPLFVCLYSSLFVYVLDVYMSSLCLSSFLFLYVYAAGFSIIIGRIFDYNRWIASQIRHPFSRICNYAVFLYHMLLPVLFLLIGSGVTCPLLMALPLCRLTWVRYKSIYFIKSTNCLLVVVILTEHSGELRFSMTWDVISNCDTMNFFISSSR